MARRTTAPEPALRAPRRRRESRALTPGDWADAALWALGEGGVEAVAVEPVARRLGVTKGSFYWHFADRAALLRAALARWEQLGTEAVIARLERLAEPRARLRRLFLTAFADAPHRRIDVALTAAADHPLVAPVLARVAQRRIAYLVAAYGALGLSPADARCAGLLAYSAYVGILHLSRTAAAQLETPAARRRYVRYLAARLMPA